MKFNNRNAMRVHRIGKTFLILSIVLIAVSFYKLILYTIVVPNQLEESFENVNSESSYENRRILLLSGQDYYEKRKHWATSNLGSILFKNHVQQFYSIKNKTFVILMWRYLSWLRPRHYGTQEGADPFDNCSVNNCIITGDDRYINSADAVVIHIQHGVLPSISGRQSYQRWVFLSDESPINSFSMAGKRPELSEWANIFNWSMTYRSDSDVPVPYGRTVPLSNYVTPSDMSDSITSLIPFWNLKKNNFLAAALISHCRVPVRMNYINELQKHLSVDVYGKCSENNLTCPGHFRNDCPILNNYIFYLAFENTKCRQYLTEKLFYNAYAKGAIPVILGAPREDCELLLPPYSYLHVNNYEDPKALAEEMMRIAKDEEALLQYHQWRRHYELRNEHGFFGTKSYHFCRLCEALNYNDESPKTYGEDDLKLFFEPKLLCDLPDVQ